MKWLLIMVLSVLLHKAYSQPGLIDSIAGYLKQIESSENANKDLWKKNLYGPLLFVEPKTRKLYANTGDVTGVLKKERGIYTGILPDNINIANTSVHWIGRDWAMIMLPLPENKNDRTNLIAHELFHRSQPALGFKLFNVDNNHLDKKEGRTYLRLELEALKKALMATNDAGMRIHLTSAFIFRKYRQQLYPGADTTENLLELNEGLAEYTGVIISSRAKNDATDHFLKSIDQFISNPTFVRSFAYQTIPVYGYLLSRNKKFWNNDVTVKTNLTDYFLKAFAVSLPKNLKKSAEKISAKYNGQIIVTEEIARQQRIDKLIADYKMKFIEQPHFDIHFEVMNISFNPNNLMPLEDKGTVYPNLRITDKWGILTVEKGALLSTGWDKVSLTNPVKFDSLNIAGDGWHLQLDRGYVVYKDEHTGNYKLSKK